MASFVYFKVHMWEGFLNKWGNMCERVCAIYLCKHLDALYGSGTGRDGHFKPLSFQRMLLNCLPLFPYQALFLLSAYTFHFSFWYFACLVMFLKTHTHTKKGTQRYTQIQESTAKWVKDIDSKGNEWHLHREGGTELSRKDLSLGTKKRGSRKKKKSGYLISKGEESLGNTWFFSYNHFTMPVLQQPPG